MSEPTQKIAESLLALGFDSEKLAYIIGQSADEACSHRVEAAALSLLGWVESLLDPFRKTEGASAPDDAHVDEPHLDYIVCWVVAMQYGGSHYDVYATREEAMAVAEMLTKSRGAEWKCWPLRWGCK